MARLKRGRARRLILDIGSNTIRVCELTLTKTGYQLTKYLQQEVLDDPALDAEDKQDQRLEALKDLLAQAKIRARKTVFGVPGRSVFTRMRALPPVPEYKVTQIVRYEIQQQIPFSLDQIALDYQVVDRTESGGYEVVMAAIKVDVVEKELEILRNVKRAVDVVDVCPLAAYNWMKHAGGIGDQGECVALLDMGASTTDIVIEHDGLFRFMRPLNLGGNDVTSAICKEFGLSFSDGERLKRQRGFAPTGDPKRDGKGGEVIGRALSRLVSEISRSFAYFRSQPGGGTVSRVIITGGAACLRNMAPYLQRELGLDVRMAQPLTGLEIGPGAQAAIEHPQQTAVALGLALRCCEAVPIEINLIPPRVLEVARRKEQAFYWVLVLATLALIVASIIPVRANENSNVLERIGIFEQYVQSYDPELLQNPTARSHFEGKLEEAKAAVQWRQKQVQSLDKAMRGRRFWLKPLMAINQARPAGNKIWFSSVETTRITRGGGQGPAARDSRSQRRGFLGLTTPAGRTSQSEGPGYVSSGFPGLEPGAAGGGRERLAGRRGGFGLGRDRDRDSGGVRQGFVAPSSLMDPKARSVAPPRANGLRVMGYARDPDALSEFIANLEAESLFGEKGVRFNEASVEMVSIAELDNALVSQRPTARTMGSNLGARDREDDRGKSRFGLRRGADRFEGDQWTRRSAPIPYGLYGETVVRFSADLQFADTIKEPSAEPEPPHEEPLLTFGFGRRRDKRR